jgi:nitroreductase
MRNHILTLTAILALAAAPSFAEKAQPFQDAMLRLLAETKTAQAFTKDSIPEADVTLILRAGINAPSARNSQGWHFSAVTDKALLAEIAKDMTTMKPGIGPDMGAPGKGPGVGKKGMPSLGGPSDNRVPGRAGLAEDIAGGPPAAAHEGDAPEMEPVTIEDPGKIASIADAPLAIVVSRTDEQGNDGFDSGLACAWMAMAAQTLGYGTRIVTSPTIALNGTKRAVYQKKLGIPAGMKAEAVLLVGSHPRQVDADSGASTRNPYDEMVSRIR